MAHKWILCALSPVFREVFKKKKEEEGEKEADDSTVSITIPNSYSLKAVKSLLHYCYQGYVDEAELKGDEAEAMFELAHYLDMTDLKEAMEVKLVKSVDQENTVNRAILAGKCSSEKLTTACISSIAANKTVLESEGWKALEKKFPDLSMELLLKAMLLGSASSSTSPSLLYPSRECMLEKRNNLISQLYFDKDSFDCSIQVDGETLRAHKCILSAHSPVFREMFSHPAALEAESGVAVEKTITNVEAFRELLRYCYEGGLSCWSMDRVNLHVPIFQLADKYCMDDLKDTMEERLIECQLCGEGQVVEMAMLADAHTAEDLMKRCIEVLADEHETVRKSAEWTKLMKERPALAAELLDKTMITLRQELDEAKQKPPTNTTTQ